jgi:hypothetical protein
MQLGFLAFAFAIPLHSAALIRCKGRRESIQHGKELQILVENTTPDIKRRAFQSPALRSALFEPRMYR